MVLLSAVILLHVLETVTADGFLDNVNKKAELFRSELLKMNEVESVSGLGLMIGITLKTKKAGDVVKSALEHGLLLLTAKDKVRLLPPLNITVDEIKEGLEIFNTVLEE